jgi:hypothetical protein
MGISHGARWLWGAVGVGGLAVFLLLAAMVGLTTRSQTPRIHPADVGEKELFFIITTATFGSYGEQRPPSLVLIDEPEISLHVKWQEMLLPAITKLNPTVQIIVATHSPEIAASAKPYVVDINGGARK